MCDNISKTLYEIADDIFSNSSKSVIDYDLNCCNYDNLRDELIKSYGKVGIVLYHDVIAHVDVDMLAYDYISSER